MNILILGAAGGTGRQLVGQALANGHKVTAFARKPSRLAINHPSLVPFEGDMRDSDAVSRALAGQEAVVSALGNPNPVRRNPELVEALASLVRTMEAHGPARLIYLSSILVPESRRQADRISAMLVSMLIAGEIADHVDKEACIVGSGLDWTLVRPPKLGNGASTGRYRAGSDVFAASIFPILPRADLAACMLGLIGDERASRSKMAVMP